MKKGAIIGLMLLFLYAGFRPPEGISKVPLADISFQAKSQHVGATSPVPNKKEPEESNKGK